MSEIEREDILAERQDQIQKMQMKSQLDQMVRDQSGRKDDSVAKAAKRTSHSSVAFEFPDNFGHRCSCTEGSYEGEVA